jgi:hypothetical protein
VASKGWKQADFGQAVQQRPGMPAGKKGKRVFHWTINKRNLTVQLLSVQ